MEDELIAQFTKQFSLHSSPTFQLQLEGGKACIIQSLHTEDSKEIGTVWWLSGSSPDWTLRTDKLSSIHWNIIGNGVVGLLFLETPANLLINGCISKLIFETKKSRVFIVRTI